MPVLKMCFPFPKKLLFFAQIIIEITLLLKLPINLWTPNRFTCYSSLAHIIVEQTNSSHFNWTLVFDFLDMPNPSQFQKSTFLVSSETCSYLHLRLPFSVNYMTGQTVFLNCQHNKKLNTGQTLFFL